MVCALPFVTEVWQVYVLIFLLSPMAAAALLMAMSFDALFLLNALAFLLSAALVVSVTLPSPRPVAHAPGVWRRVSHGMRIYLKTPRLRGLLALNLAVSAAGAMQIVNTVVVVRSTLGLGEREVALAFAAAGGGSMLVALMLPKVLEWVPERPVMLLGGALMTLSLSRQGDAST
ncbi:hypothetical protein [Halomonas kalidii]|uniref:MFS transporter n=1 Tax=Halomonas kalidii TaxID=3043293 RepID=A0ABT6VJ24_9GAMM|nr:hypothetical protein [Halomonas kalidii]MDI5933982.1 hypothetical protein [Halomonas kalidii]